MGYVEELRKKIGHAPVILTGAIVVITNEKDEILLQQRTYPKGKWGLPGGLMELKESTEETARREVFEETALTLNELHLIDVISGAHCYCQAENGDEFYVVTVGYHSKNPIGTMKIDETESISFKYLSPEHLPENIAKTHLTMIHKYLEKRTT